MPMTAKSFKRILEQIEDNTLVVLFEFRENDEPAKESFSIDKVELRGGKVGGENFLMLINEEFDGRESVENEDFEGFSAHLYTEDEFVPEGVGD